MFSFIAFILFRWPIRRVGRVIYCVRFWYRKNAPRLPFIVFSGNQSVSWEHHPVQEWRKESKGRAQRVHQRQALLTRTRCCRRLRWVTFINYTIHQTIICDHTHLEVEYENKFLYSIRGRRQWISLKKIILWDRSRNMGLCVWNFHLFIFPLSVSAQFS